MRRIVVPGLVVLTAMFGAPAAASAAPVPAAASPRHLLVSVSCKAVKTCVAAGVDVNTNRPMAQAWNGVKWAGSDLKLPARAARGNMERQLGDTAIAFNNAFSDAWNGHSWKFARLPTPNQGGAGRASAVWSVSCVTATDCAAVGSAGTTQGLVFGFSGFWNGESWRLVPLA